MLEIAFFLLAGPALVLLALAALGLALYLVPAFLLLWGCAALGLPPLLGFFLGLLLPLLYAWWDDRSLLPPHGRRRA